MELDGDDGWARGFLFFNANWSGRYAILLGFEIRVLQFLRSARVGTFNPRNVYLNEGRMVVAYAARRRYQCQRRGIICISAAGGC